MTCALRYRLTPAQWQAAQSVIQRYHGRRAAGVAWNVSVVVIWALVGLLVAALAAHIDDRGPPYLGRLVWAACALVGFASLLQNRLSRYFAARHLLGGDSPYLQWRTLSLTESGLLTESGGVEVRYPYRALISVEHRGDVTYLFTNMVGALLIPDQAFDDAASRQAFFDALKQHMAAAGVTPLADAAATAVLTDAAPPATYIRNVRHNLRYALRSLALFPSRRSLPNGAWGQLFGWLALGLIQRFAADLITVGRDGQLATDALADQLLVLPVILLTAWLLSRLSGQVQATLRLAIGLAVSWVLLGLLQSAYYVGVDRQWLPAVGAQGDQLAAYLPVAWLALSAAITAIRAYGLSWRRSAGAFVLAAVCIGLPLVYVYKDQSLWVAPPDDNAEQSTATASPADEDAFYHQPDLLDQALAAVQPPQGDRPNLYFVGVAGNAEQDVFMKEVQSVAHEFADRFGTAGHSVVLINNPKTVNEVPIASATALDATLQRLGQVMNRDRDILFVYLTSHGAPDNSFNLAFDPLQLHDLTPPQLREILDQSGIKRRVVVVSACYSGGFIDALKDDNTLVITAAAADRTSFGCSNELDFTYFGKAYFDEALRQTDSFIDAFAIAQRRVAAREAQDGYAPSEPQISVGRQIAAPLADWQAHHR